MELFQAVRERKSCRAFAGDGVEREMVEKILEAATCAPSPLNTQPWEFLVITGQELKDRIHGEAVRCKAWAQEKSGWKWLGKYSADFLKTTPVIIAVIGDPKGTGVDMFLEEGSTGFQHACAAAVQNMLLTAHALGLGGLWFTFFDKKNLREILGVSQDKVPVALVCLGKPLGEPTPMPRKSFEEKTTWL